VTSHGLVQTAVARFFAERVPRCVAMVHSMQHARPGGVSSGASAEAPVHAPAACERTPLQQVLLPPVSRPPPCAAPRRSNLVDMSHDMSIQFGQEVPLYSKPPNWPASPPPAQPAYTRPPQGTFQAHNPIHGCAPPRALRQPWQGLWE
jgi:hypothetical protein